MGEDGRPITERDALRAALARAMAVVAKCAPEMEPDVAAVLADPDGVRALAEWRALEAVAAAAEEEERMAQLAGDAPGGSLIHASASRAASVAHVELRACFAHLTKVRRG